MKRNCRSRFLEKKKSPSEQFAGLLFILVVVTGCSLFYVWTRTEAIELSYRVRETLNLEKSLLAQSKRLKYDFARIISPERLELIAKRDLNLRDPRSGQIIYIDSN